MDGSILAYFLGIMDPAEPFFIAKVVGISEKEKQKMNEICKHHGLQWYGEPNRPVLYRACVPSVENVKKFHIDLLNFFEEVGYAEI